MASSYCKTISEPLRYYDCRGFIEDGDSPRVVWRLRCLGSEQTIILPPDAFAQNYVPCSPAEALGSLF